VRLRKPPQLDALRAPGPERPDALGGRLVVRREDLLLEHVAAEAGTAEMHAPLSSQLYAMRATSMVALQDS